MKIWLVRHGETDANLQKRFQGWTDLPLNAAGLRQAEWLRRELGHSPLRQIFASPLRRAMQTAGIIAEGSRGESAVVPVEAIKELNFGQWDGRSSAEIAANDPETYQRWLDQWERTAPPGGESAAAMYDRVCDWFGTLVRKTDQRAEVVIVTHEGVILQILAHLLGLGLAGCWHFRVEPGSISLAEITDGFAVITMLNHRERAPENHRSMEAEKNG